MIQIRPAQGNLYYGLIAIRTKWEELVSLLENIEAWEQEWHQPFEAVRAAWDTSSPAPDEDPFPDDETLVDLVHRVRDEIV